MVKTTVAAWSPDGRTVAYANRTRAAREGLVSVVVIGRDGQSARDLQTFSGDVIRLRWAPDGRFIRVSLATRIDRDVLETLWDVDLSGKPRRVFSDARVPIFDGADWLISTGEEMFYGPRGASQIWLRQAAPHEGAEHLREITSGALQFVQSIPNPDGTRLYAIGNSGPRLLRYDADERRFTPYLEGLAAFGLTFSRDRKWITYITEADGVLWRAAADGSGAKPLTKPPFRVDGASISPDGSRIAVRGGFDQRLKVYLIGADGGVPEPLTADDVVQGIPSWSKRGDQLTYGDVPERHGLSTGTEHIHVFDLKRHAASDLPDANEPLWSSRWSPDGRFIAALTIADQRLLIFDVEKRTWRSLGITHVNSPEWTRDSRFVWCGPEGATFLFRRVSVDTGTVDRAIDVAPYTRQHDGAGLSSDEAPLLLQSTLDLYAIDLRRTAVKPQR